MMIRDYYSVGEIAEILDIYEISAKELLDGIIRFTKDELEELARFKGVSVEELVV